MDKGIFVVIRLKGKKPQTIVNLHSSWAEGADFYARLLKLVKMIKN